jgi:hypothetical protein
MMDLRKCEGVSARTIEFAILTACRSGGVRGALVRDQPGCQAVEDSGRAHGRGEDHRVSLSTSALALLAAMKRHDGYFFLLGQGDVPF